MKNLKNKQLKKLLSYLSDKDDFIFFDSARLSSDDNTSYLFVDPVEKIIFRKGEDITEFFLRIEKIQKKDFFVAGWFSYEFGYFLEEKLDTAFSKDIEDGFVLADLGVFAQSYCYDHKTGETDFPINNHVEKDKADCKIGKVVPNMQCADYLEAVGKIKEYIEAGDTYQVNYTFKLLFDFIGSIELLYLKLRENQTVPFGAFVRSSSRNILSFSPELFFKKKNCSLKVKPMKGTYIRGRNLEEDKYYQEILSNDTKNRSENVMIVDLLRNDLANLMYRLQDGDVNVKSLFDVEVYETVLQMTSTVYGKLNNSSIKTLPLLSLFKALFPCGSVTGAPKIRTMEITNELEQDLRGVYTGAIGCFMPDGNAVFNVPIRTVVVEDGKGQMGVGSGIIYDSDPAKEWDECLLKADFITNQQGSFELIETILYDHEEGFWLLEDHLQRLFDSADYFLFSYDKKDIRKKLAEVSKSFEEGCTRVRLTLSKDSTVIINNTKCDEPVLVDFPDKIIPNEELIHEIAISDEIICHESPWFQHKTTNREIFNREYKNANLEGLLDKCFINDEGNLTEGCITNIFIYKDGVYMTPPVNSGLLPGVMRKQLLANKEIPVWEKEISKDDLESADAIFVCNSIRGVIQVRLRS